MMLLSSAFVWLDITHTVAILFLPYALLGKEFNIQDFFAYEMSPRIVSGKTKTQRPRCDKTVQYTYARMCIRMGFNVRGDGGSTMTGASRCFLCYQFIGNGQAWPGLIIIVLTAKTTVFCAYVRTALTKAVNVFSPDRSLQRNLYAHGTTPRSTI